MYGFWVEANSKTLFCNFRPYKYLMQRSKWSSFQSFFFSKCTVFAGDLDTGKQTVDMDKQTDSTFSDLSHYQDSDAKIETISGSWDCFTVSWTLLIESLMEEIEQVAIHKRNIWKDTFLKFNGFSFALPVYEDCDTRDKTVYFSMEYLCTNKRISIQTWMKDLNCVFLAKSEFQRLCSSILFALFGISSMWELQNDMIQQIHFWNNFVSFFSKMN